tara:strand:+ start:176 stop:826 length:651 start_codon:yes stop_codon:yes gene_type:complete
MINNNNTQDADVMVERLSDAAKHMLLMIGTEWRDMTGNAASYVDQGLLLAIYEMTEPWTMNKLKTKSGYGLAGIKYGVIPTFKRRGLLISINQGNSTYFELSEPGREVLRLLVLNCSRCNNTRVCQRCDGSGLLSGEHDSRCQHENKRDCTTCNGTGKDETEPGESCWNCENKNDACTECDENRVKYCYYCKNNDTPLGTCSYCNVARVEGTIYNE